jgi:hypothetical protein
MGAAAIPGILGAVGLYQSGQQAKAQQKMQRRGMKAGEADAKITTGAKQSLADQAKAYDPKETTRLAVDTASKTAGATLESALQRLNTSYGGKNPAGDTRFSVNAQRATNDALDPLKAFAANEAALEPFRKAEMTRMVLNAPTGQLADTYFKGAALMPQSDPSGSLALLSQAIARMQGGGAGGSGDRSLRAAPGQNPTGNEYPFQGVTFGGLNP